MVRFWDDWAGQSLYFYEIYFRMLNPVAMEKALNLICKGRPGWERAAMKVVFKRRYPKKLAAQGIGKLAPSEVERLLTTHLDGLEAILGKREWLVGASMTLADLSVAGQPTSSCGRAAWPRPSWRARTSRGGSRGCQRRLSGKVARDGTR